MVILMVEFHFQSEHLFMRENEVWHHAVCKLLKEFSATDPPFVLGSFRKKMNSTNTIALDFQILSKRFLIDIPLIWSLAKSS